MSQFTQWLSMHGYALYVWPAYGIVSVVFILNVLMTTKQTSKTRQQLKQWFKSQC